MQISSGSPASPDNDAIRELRDGVNRLNKTIETSNKVNEKFTLILLTVALFQLLVPFFLGGVIDAWKGVLVEVFLFIFLYFVVGLKHKNRKSEKS